MSDAGSGEFTGGGSPDRQIPEEYTDKIYDDEQLADPGDPNDDLPDTTPPVGAILAERITEAVEDDPGSARRDISDDHDPDALPGAIVSVDKPPRGEVGRMPTEELVVEPADYQQPEPTEPVAGSPDGEPDRVETDPDEERPAVVADTDLPVTPAGPGEEKRALGGQREQPEQATLPTSTSGEAGARRSPEPPVPAPGRPEPDLPGKLEVRSAVEVTEPGAQDQADANLNHLLRPPEESTIFEESRLIRPTIQQIAAFITRGATEDSLEAAGELHGYSRPPLHEVLQELDFALPYVDRLTDILATNFGDRRLLFAGRDAEVLWDMYGTAHPDKDAGLLPASTQLWTSSGMLDRDMAVAFLDEYGLDHASVMRGDIVLVDSGFEGYVGYLLWQTLKRIHGTRTEDIRRHLPIWLISASDGARWGQQLADFDQEAASLSSDPFPRATKAQGGLTTFDPNNYGLTESLATFMQLMPRYHGPYKQLVKQGDQVVAIPDNSTVSRDTEIVQPPNINSSIVNTLAAAIVQYRAVKHALR